MLYLATDQFIGQSIDRYGEFSEYEVELFRQLIRPGQTILDIGANMGAHLVFFAKAVGPQGSVLAFEPQRVLFQILCANASLNALPNVHAHHAAVGREAAAIKVPALDYSIVQNYGGLALGNWLGGESVPVITVDSLNLPACHLMKIDVEGMEGDVVAGAEQTIRRFHPIIYAENDRPERSASLIQQLLGLGYRLYWHIPPLFHPENYFGVAENVFGHTASINMLALPASMPQDIRGLREITSPNDSWRG